MAAGGTPGQRYLAYLDQLSGGVEPRIIRVESLRPDLKGVAAIVYDAAPEPGWLTAMTWGLSLARHPEWVHFRPELCLCVASDDDRWARAVAEVAERLRGRAAFHPTETIDFGRQISAESAMSSFVVFDPAVIEPNVAVDIGEDLPVSIAGIYPIHDIERQYIDEYGLEEFWESDFDPADVRRPSLVDG